MKILMINFACGHEEDKLLTGDPVTRATTLIKDVSRSILNIEIICGIGLSDQAIKAIDRQLIKKGWRNAMHPDYKNDPNKPYFTQLSCIWVAPGIKADNIGYQDIDTDISDLRYRTTSIRINDSDLIIRLLHVPVVDCSADPESNKFKAQLDRKKRFLVWEKDKELRFPKTVVIGDFNTDPSFNDACKDEFKALPFQNILHATTWGNKQLDYVLKSKDITSIQAKVADPFNRYQKHTDHMPILVNIDI